MARGHRARARDRRVSCASPAAARSGGCARRRADWRVLIEYGLQGTRSNAHYFAQTLPQIAAQRMSGSERPALLAELRNAGREAAAAYLRLRAYIAATFFDGDAAQGARALKAPYRADHFAFGEAEYDWALSNNFKLKTSASELFSESWPIVAASRAAMVALARTIAADHKWQVRAKAAVKSCAARSRSSAAMRPRAMRRCCNGIAKLACACVAYARHTGLFDVPVDYRLDVIVTPPPLRASIEGAAYYPAPIFKNSGVGRFYVNPTGNNPAALAHEHNRAALPDLAAHEGFPGHDWHYKVMTLHKEDISPVRWITPGAVEDSSSMWQDSLAAEGWALSSRSAPRGAAAQGAGGILFPGGASLSAARQALSGFESAHRYRDSHRTDVI